MPRNNQRTDVSRQELQRLEARLTSLAGRTARQASDSDELPVDAVDTVNIANDAVTEDKIADGAVTFKKLASGGTTSGGGGNYSSQAETRRSGATTTTEIYYTARPDGDGYAESEVSDVGETDTIQRRLYYSDKFDADPDTSGDWTAYTTQPADDETFANAKAALLAGLSDTDGTANTRGTLPVSLKMERTTVAPATLLLDTYTGASVAYSIRKLRSAYTGNCLRVREASGNTEADIGFDSNGDLDTAAIASHCGSANGFVVKWYDQSGNADDVLNSTTSQQPQIYNGSSTLTLNGKPAVDFDGGDVLATSGNITLSDNAFFNACVFSFDSTSGIKSISASDASPRVGVFFRLLSSSVSQSRGFNSSGSAFTANGPTATINTQHLGVGEHTGSALTAYLDGTGGSSVSFANRTDAAPFFLGAPNSSLGESHRGYIQEVVHYPDDQSGNRTGIQTDLNTYFSIY